MPENTEKNKFPKNPVAYFCAEFALVNDMPSYAGGLGVLAGDYILEAAKQDFPIVGVGLYYQKGQNHRTSAGEPDAAKFGLKLKEGLRISLPIGNKDILAQVWYWKKKNNFVYFLDTNISENEPADRLITEQLYAEDRELRLKQELVLGIGGIRLLKALNVTPAVYHLNEGHSAFLILELIGEEIKKSLSFSEASKKVKKNIVFTNHTLVLEGQEMFALDSLTRATEKLCRELNIKIEDVIAEGKIKPTDNLFSMTTFALNGARLTNAVSKIHGEKAKELWPGFPIIHITNGIYLSRWDKVKNANLVKSHQKNEEKLLELIRETQGDNWKKDSLLIGWSRRFVPYKRPLALVEDVAKLKKILETFPGKVHIVYSAPLDKNNAEHNEFLKKIYELMAGELKGYLTFIPHYKIGVAQTLTAGCDVWLNTPVVGREACGTSGMKAGLNGTLSVSTNDGWVAETPLNDFGWLVDDKNITANLLQKLQTEIIPEYEKFVKDRKSAPWKNRMIKARNLIRQNFSTARMLRDYVAKLYRL